MNRIALTFLVLPLFACASVTATTTSVRAIVDANNNNIERWYAQGATDSLASMFASDAWQMPPNNSPLIGRDAIQAFWHQAMSWGKWEFSLHAQDVQSSGSVAIERGKYKMSFTAGPGAPPGTASTEDRGNYVVYWRRDPDGIFRIVWDAPVSEVRPSR